jgi:DNA-binding transcriptional ArsR family regulator
VTDAALPVDRTLLALADPTRRRVIELLREEPRRAGELAASFRMAPPAMSRHLRVLRTSGLVEERGLPEDARVRVYRLRSDPFHELRAWLDQVAEFWSDQLGAFKAHAERTPGVTRDAPAARVRARGTPAGGRRPRRGGAR